MTSRKSVLALTIMALTAWPSVSGAQVVARHSGASPPVSVEGWTSLVTGPGSHTVFAANDNGVEAWGLRTTLRSLTYKKNLTNAHVTGPYGWRCTVVLRAVKNDHPHSNDIKVDVDDGTDRWQFNFLAGDDTLPNGVYWNGGGPVSNPNDPGLIATVHDLDSEYHEFAFVFVPGSLGGLANPDLNIDDCVTVFLDGLCVGFVTRAETVPTTSSPHISWGDGTGLLEANAESRWNLVEFEALQTPLDSDSDGLTDGEEGMFGTDPNDPDTDDDGLQDGTEVDMAMGSGCPNPLNPDSDGDTLDDGFEVALGTSPCNADSDADGVTDNDDPLPLDPGVTSGFIEDSLRDLAVDIDLQTLDLFTGKNANAAAGRRNALSNKAHAAANAVAGDDIDGAIGQLLSLLAKIDDQPAPPDWMVTSTEKTQFTAEVELLIELLLLL